MELFALLIASFFIELFKAVLYKYLAGSRVRKFTAVTDLTELAVTIGKVAANIALGLPI